MMKTFSLLILVAIFQIVHNEETSPLSMSSESPSTTESVQDKLTRICNLPKAEGPCTDKAMSRYYYDSESKKCKEFVFTGCFGNENNFETREACEELCMPKTDQPTPSGPPK